MHDEHVLILGGTRGLFGIEQMYRQYGWTTEKAMDPDV